MNQLPPDVLKHVMNFPNIPQEELRKIIDERDKPIQEYYAAKEARDAPKLLFWVITLLVAPFVIWAVFGAVVMLISAIVFHTLNGLYIVCRPIRPDPDAPRPAPFPWETAPETPAPATDTPSQPGA